MSAASSGSMWPMTAGGTLARHLDERRRGELFVHLFEGVGGERRRSARPARRRADAGRPDRSTSARSAGCSLAISAKASMKLACDRRTEMRLTSLQGTKSPGRAARRRDRKAETHAPHDGAARGVDAGHDERPVADVEQHVLYAHELAALDVEHLVVEHGVDQGDLVAGSDAPASWSAVADSTQSAAVDVDLGDLVPGRAELLVVAAHDAAGDGGRFAGQGGEHVEQLAEVGARRRRRPSSTRARKALIGRGRHPRSCGRPFWSASRSR